jgi:hypothetical protein
VLDEVGVRRVDEVSARCAQSASVTVKLYDICFGDTYDG